MFDYSLMIKRAIEFFPTWSDIRKRSTKSIGGQLVSSALNETLELEKAIQEYKDFYFINKYEGKEEQVVAYVYATDIGKIDDLTNIKFKYNNQEYPLTLNINDFYNNIELSYYENGKLYIREEVIKDNLLNITMLADNHEYTFILEKVNVWNIFDEFACFVGLERQEDESNEKLLKRILFSTKNIANNTEQGLKNAILTELMSDIDIKENDIEISKVTPETLVKPYKTFNSLLDMLSSINRDALKDKRWDLDKWEYDFKSIQYLDNAWDAAISQYQNGIGYGDDLKVVISDDKNISDAEIVLYDKSEVKLNKYVQDKNIQKEIKFNLKRYENILNPIHAKYLVKASEAVDITNEEIELSVYENNERRDLRRVEEIYKFGKDIVAVDNSKLTDENNYRLEFYANSNFDNMKISKCNVIYKHKITNEVLEVRNLLKQSPGFVLNAQGDLVNNSIKRTVKSVKNFNRYENLIDSNEGIVLAQNMNEGKAVLNISGLGLNLVKLDYDNQLVDIPKSLIKHNSFAFWREDELVFRYDNPHERKFEININCNTLSFDILEGEADVFLEIDGKSSYHKIKSKTKFNIEESLEPKNVKLTVISNHNGPVKFSNFKYCSHKLSLALESGELIEDSAGLRLPNFAVNNLIVTMSSNSSSTPILKGIYIGANTNNIKYKTEVIESISNTNRIIEISSNCLCDLLHVDVVGNTIKATKNYTPAISYKAIKDNAWIRLNLEQYDLIKEVIVDTGSIHIEEESGVNYYNIVLKMGQSISFVTIDGIRNAPAKTISLLKMIKSYMPTFDESVDKVYASRLANGLIIADSDPHNPKTFILEIKNNIFQGVNASKYKFTKIPKTLGVIFKSGDSQVQALETTLPFDSLTFIPGGSKIYQAVNEANIYTGEVRNIKILNNFSPVLNTSTMLMYTVDNFESDLNYNVKFCTELDKNNSFETLSNWSLGMKNIAIKTPIDLSNTENYEITNIEITDEVLLNRYIELKPSYKLTSNLEIFTNRYMVIPEDLDCEVLYERYSETQNENLIIQEEVIMEDDGFTKLNYSNIDQLLYIGTTPYAGINQEQIKEYILLKDEGIMIWTDKSLIDEAKKVFLRYTIKNPKAILLSEDALYKAIGYNVDAYEEINRIVVEDIYDGYRYDLRQIDNYNKVDLVYTSCSSPSFQSDNINDVLVFKKVAAEDTILVKTGYYYINGKEYYLFPSKDQIVLDNEKYLDMQHVDISGGEITLFKESNNFVRNSEMLFRGINELYNFDASKSQVKGVSTLNQITACDSFNQWHTFGTNLVLKDGLNDLGIHFMPEIPNGYAYLDITSGLTEGKNYLSFWADKTLEIYIGTESKYLGLDFNDSININIAHEIPYRDDLIRSTVIDYKPNSDNNKYYLIVKSFGTLDDIVITKENDIVSCHKKNIDMLGLDIKETYQSGQKFRIFIDDNKHIYNNGALLTKDNKIKTSSNIYWGISPIKKYNNKFDFSTCHTENIHFENNYIKTSKTEGILETAPIFIENPMTIKRLIFKVNDITFDDMKGVKVHILSSTTKDGNYLPINVFNDNHGFVYGDTLMKYVKLKLVIPEHKYINNISLYAEYKSTEANAPRVITPSYGELITKVYDAQYSADYKIRDLSIEEISNLSDVDIYVRSSKDDYSADVWHDWKKLNLVEYNNIIKIKEAIKFEQTRFFQVKIALRSSNAYIKINNIDIEVM